MIQKIISVKDPRLREKSKNVFEIDKKVRSVIQDLKDTLNIQKDPIGVGLAAPQIGKNLRIFAVKPKDVASIIINPQILFVEKNKTEVKEEKLMEGCLSLPNYYGPLKRPGLTKLNYLDENGNKITKVFQGFDSQIIQHEIDHLEGILFIDRLLEQKKPLYELINGEWEKVELI
jgi:peptide deformylase